MDATMSKPTITPNVYKWGVNMNTNEAVKAMGCPFIGKGEKNEQPKTKKKERSL